MTKTELRTLYKDQRKEFSSDEILLMSYRILDNLKELDIWTRDTYHTFLPIERHYEVNTYPVVTELFDLRKNIVVPKMSGESMINCQIENDFQIEVMRYGIPEPLDYTIIDSKEIDVVFLPMLICDLRGNRVGYGKGFYDRWLNTCRRNVLKIGINFFDPIERIDDVNELDIPLDYCVSPYSVVSFSERKSSVLFLSKERK